MDETYKRMNPWWNGLPFETGIKRPVCGELTLKSRQRKQIEIITGSRRTGKTTLMMQMIAERLKETEAKYVFYANLEDPALIRTPIRRHIDAFRTGFAHKPDDFLYLFFDEVQESPAWELELKAAYDAGGVKIFVTGSTSHMISMRGGKLTGRQATTCLYPLDFGEYLQFKNLQAGPESLDLYLQEGGYPEQVLHNPPDYMQSLTGDIITRDIIRYFKPRKDHEVFGLFTLLCGALGHRISYSRFKDVLGITVDTIKDYISYFEMAYLASVLEKWSDSPNDRIYANRKVYLYDTGFKTAIDGKRDAGAKAENTLFVLLKKTGARLGYFAESDREVDFIVETQAGSVPVESKYVDEIEADDARLAGLKLYIKKHAPKQAYVATRSYAAEFELAGLKVAAVPLWKILVEGLPFSLPRVK